MAKHKYGITQLNGTVDYVICEVTALTEGILFFGSGPGFVDGSKPENFIIGYSVANIKDFFYVATVVGEK